MSGGPTKERRWRGTFVVAFVAIGVVIATIAIHSVRAHAVDMADKVQRELEAIARLKATTLTEWQAERRADLSYLTNHPRLREALLEAARPGGDPSRAAADIAELLDPLRANHSEFESITVEDAGGRTIARVGEDQGSPLPFFDAATSPMRFSRLEPVGHPPRLRLDAEAPVQGDGADAALGRVRVRIDPSTILRPLLTPYEVGYRHELELLRVTAPGAQVEVLARAGDDEEAVGWRPVLPGTVESRAFASAGELLEGSDEAQRDVVAMATRFPDRPWMLMVRSARRDAMAGRGDRLRAVMLEAILGLAVAGAGLLLLERRRDAELLRLELRNLAEERRRERELAETQIALAESRARLVNIISSAPDAIVSVEQDGRISLCNEAAARIVGLPAETILGQRITDLLPPAMHARVLPRLGLHGEGDGKGGMLELSFRRSDDGSDGAIEASFSPQESGGRRSCTIIFRDLSERRRAEERNRILARLVEQSSNLLVVTDTSGAISWVNPRFEAVTGWTLDEVRGKTPRVLQSGRTPRAVYQELWSAVLGGSQWQGELVNHTKAGHEYRARVTIAPIFDDSGQVIQLAGIQEDVTEQRRLEQEFQQAQKLETLGMVTGGVAHDFNNMLSAILGYAELAAEALPPGSTPRDDIEEVRTICGRAAGLTRQLLAFSRRQPIAPANVDLNALLLNLFKMLRRLVGEDIELVVLPDDEPAWIRADAGQIEQVVMNLAVNARDAMPHGGKLRIELDHVRLGAGGQRAPAGLADGPFLSLRVIDTGTGMTADTMEHLFEPFFTTKEKGRGTGLGLATTFGIVKQSGGHIRAETALGVGSTFEVLLPEIQVEEDRFEAAQRKAADEPAHDERVLLVEDDPQVRSMLRRALSRAGYRVTEAAHGEEALRILDGAGPHAFALLLTDLVMPRLGGVELAEHAQRLDPAVRVLFMSGYADDMALRGRVLEATNFVAKPFTPAVILDRVRAVLREGTSAG